MPFDTDEKRVVYMPQMCNCAFKIDLLCVMLRYSIILLFSICVCEYTSAQNYTFSPSENYTGELSMDMYTEHYIYIGHNLPDTAFITWRVVGNTCP